jgi:hypothetical protein
MALLHVFLGCMLFFKFFHHEHLSIITIMGCIISFMFFILSRLLLRGKTGEG